MINNRDIMKFVKELKMRGVEYDHHFKQHWDGIKIVTNDEMKTMCSNRFKREYTLLTPPEQRRIRVKVFDGIEGEQDG